MPLIILTGFPCSGKTHRAQQLAFALSQKISSSNPDSIPDTVKITVNIIPSYHDSVSPNSDDVNSMTRDAIYNSVVLEKNARACEISAIKRAISKNAIVIVDDLNYIKGFRYQLWCEAKAAGTRCCTIHCAAREDEVVLWNRERLKDWAQIQGAPFGEETEAKAELQVFGITDEMTPESHTAIYGDRIPNASPESKTSSQGGNHEEDDSDEGRPTVRLGETLASLSLSQSQTERAPEPSHSEQQAISAKTEHLPDVAEFPPPTRQPYSTTTIQSLLLRYEPPSPFSKWDTPLFTVPASDTEPPISDIWKALFPAPEALSFRRTQNPDSKPEVKPHLATVQPRMTEADALQSLERVTADIVGQILQWSKSRSAVGDEGGEMECTYADASTKLSIPAGTVVSLPMLHRLKRRFLQRQRGAMAHGRGQVSGESATGEAFVRFLNSELLE